MSAVATAIAGSAIIGGVTSSMAASSAAGAQVDAANAANRAASRQFERQVQLQEPFRQGGLTAQQQYMTLLGLSPNTVYAGGRLTPSTGTGKQGAANAGLPPELQADPNNPEFGKYARDFSMADFQADPGYAFRLSEGLKALEGRAAARGGLLSGNTLLGITDYGQNAASQEYTNAFNRYQVNRSNRLNPLENLMGAARSSTNQLAARPTCWDSSKARTLWPPGRPARRGTSEAPTHCRAR